jgi:hypothetical protein
VFSNYSRCPERIIKEQLTPIKQLVKPAPGIYDTRAKCYTPLTAHDRTRDDELEPDEEVEPEAETKIAGIDEGKEAEDETNV